MFTKYKQRLLVVLISVAIFLSLYSVGVVWGLLVGGGGLRGGTDPSRGYCDRTG